MIRAILPALLAAFLPVTASAAQEPGTYAQGPDPQARLDQLTAGSVAGEPRRCLLRRFVTRTENIPGIGVVYRTADRGLLFVNRPIQGAEFLRRDSILVARRSSGQICQTDPVEIVEPVNRFGRGYITLGEFVPYRRTPEVEARIRPR